MVNETYAGQGNGARRNSGVYLRLLRRSADWASLLASTLNSRRT